MKKSIIAIVVVLMLVSVLAIGLTACNNDEKNTNSLLFGKELLPLTAQIDTLTQLNNGSADIAVMDSIMAGYYTSRGDFAGKMSILPELMLSEEDYGIGAKSTSKALMSKVNEAMIALYNNGKMQTIAAKYGLENEIKINAETTDPYAGATDDSWNQLVAAKKVVIGYTEFAPIAYKENDQLVGYDVELAKAVFDYLNETYGTQIEIEMTIIEWSKKVTFINNGSIDLIWNGMTIDPVLSQELCISVPYLANKQSCVVLTSDLDKYDTIAKFMKNSKNAIVAVENGSAAYKLLTMEI